nr:DGQHR domain-containing protein [Candidatus Woesearchaeota archaeon]
MKQFIEINALSVKQPLGNFYVGIISARDLLDISHADVRRIEKDDIERHIGIQRPLNLSRVKEIKEYVKTFDASFPNSIIISIGKEYISFKNMSENKLIIERNKNAATIIDGQHRLAGFENNPIDNFDLIITIFLDLEREEQALLFSIINTKHTKVNPSLAADLLEFSSIITPAKIAHNIAKTMNSDRDGPWYKLIRMLGTRSELYEGIITQSTFTKEIINLICRNEDLYKIRDIIKKEGRKSLIHHFNRNYEKYIFWNFYVDNKDEFIFKILNNYFTAIKNVFKNEWANKKYILTKTTGYIALMKLFPELFIKGKNDEDLSINFFQTYFEKVKNSLKELVSDNYESGLKGTNRLYKDLSKEL